ncbi:hypothetical protein CIW48_15550 [Methylobacterium sp. P1-11]|uniref:DUF6894 family protein n=1 Tax=Methylobacterium sp. P1-11 TaxID=2024616 RepID=UPI0011EC8583|nr:hypothetical protein [Methylobacterium sp. P1-11]KAA0122855.1 hypothetical protein CIW48_15550 [Methylobacterium sp. P1-11]
MAPRFFFDVSNGVETILDDESVEAADLDEALTEARSVIAEMADEVIEANPDQSWVLIVRDEAGLVVGRLPIQH